VSDAHGQPAEALGGAPLRVLLDVTAMPHSLGGVGRYAMALAGALHQRDDVTLTLVSRRHDAARWASVVRGGSATSRAEGTVLGIAPTVRPLRLAWEQLRFPRFLNRLSPDVHHGPHYTMPERTRVPVVVTVHDCTFFDHPEWHEWSKVTVFRRAIRTAARRAAAIVCVSESTAHRLDELCDVRVPVVVAPHGVDHGVFGPEEPAPGADEAALRAAGVDPSQPYVLFLGTIEPRKNVPALVRAFDRLAVGQPDLRLVLAGQPGWGADEVDKAIYAAERHRDRVVQTGYVPDASVPALLRRAAVVVYPSLEEGFGLPALEALACGAPLVTTAGTAMAEVSAGAAVLVPPADTADLGDAIESVLSAGTEEAAARRARGLAVAEPRTWAASAAAHLRAYRVAAESGVRPGR